MQLIIKQRHLIMISTVYLISILSALVTIIVLVFITHSKQYQDTTTVDGIIIPCNNPTACQYPFNHELHICYNATSTPATNNTICSVTIDAISGSCTEYSSYTKQVPYVTPLALVFAVIPIVVVNWCVVLLRLYPNTCACIKVIDNDANESETLVLQQRV